ncbi:restriction endonuclease subunit S [Helicobacter pylori]|uniref:restriction endonuclease subunit S n=1 Tax=Helicobacter pylori TaxID=210 RepID=UPI001237DE13|nr:restriction endonuclease subunit S [Helicobacter pylori]KAA6507870.1 restriction endonuclease subunit S [Helicobacter pylori]KAA6515419.1 restriction endonuclease subunit S [Helicobacter pylori]
MNKIERLLQTLAPKGVEFRKLGEVCDFQKGKSITKKAVTFGKVPVISGGRQPAYYHNEANRSGETIAISSSGVYAGYVSYWDIPVFLADSFSVSPKQKTLMPKYLFHYLTTQQDAIHATKSTGGIPHVYSKDLQNFLIPIPPLEIQQEIVKILDAFTELNTELKARKKQYQYYQNMLLDFKDTNQSHKDAKISAKTYPKRLKTLLQTLAPKGVEFKTLEEVFEIKNGYTPSKNNPEFWEKGTIPWFRMEDIRENGRILKDSIQHITPKALKGKKLFPKNSIIISTTATIGEHALLIVDSLANQQFTFLSKKANCDIALDMKFFFYQCFLLGEWCKNNTNVSGFASVDMTAFKKYKFPIPPLEIQQEIVKILDQFSALTTDLLAGIPAEIKARKKQYEYYREKLLTFKPLTPNKEGEKG